MAVLEARRRFTRSSSFSILNTSLLTSPDHCESDLESLNTDVVFPAVSITERTESPHLLFETSSPSKSITNLSTAKTLIKYLRKDRNHWRTLALNEDKRLETSNRHLENHKTTILNLTSLNKDLEIHLEETKSTEKDLRAGLQNAATMYNKLVREVNEKIRIITRLKKSDRAKEKVQQRNLALKAALRSVYSYQSSKLQNNVEDALLEALAAATDRITELENAGEKLLDALDRAKDESHKSDDSGCGDIDEDLGDREVSLIEAEICFRNVLEDEGFAETKELWGDLLEG